MVVYAQSDDGAKARVLPCTEKRRMVRAADGTRDIHFTSLPQEMAGRVGRVTVPNEAYTDMRSQGGTATHKYGFSPLAVRYGLPGAFIIVNVKKILTLTIIYDYNIKGRCCYEAYTRMCG